MKSFAAVVAALLVTAGAANAGENAGEILITPKASDSVLVLTIRGGKVGAVTKPEPVAKPEHLKDTGAANVGEIVINPKASDRAVVLTLRGGKVVKASVIAKPESMAKLEHLKDTAPSP
jgi:archaeosine-15-forming tRNA-guanine transglycosylase